MLYAILYYIVPCYAVLSYPDYTLRCQYELYHTTAYRADGTVPYRAATRHAMQLYATGSVYVLPVDIPVGARSWG